MMLTNLLDCLLGQVLVVFPDVPMPVFERLDCPGENGQLLVAGSDQEPLCVGLGEKEPFVRGRNG
jgi:hypothetical protein